MMARAAWNNQSLDEWARLYAPGRFMDVEGHSTHFIEKGAGSPVILIHGFFYDTFLWHNNIDALARRATVYAIDLWGFGYSTREPMDYGYPLYARQLLGFMDALGIQKASLIGQSMGGGTILPSPFLLAYMNSLTILLLRFARAPRRLMHGPPDSLNAL